MRGKMKPLPTLVGVAIVVILSSFFYNLSDSSSQDKHYQKIIETIFAGEKKNIRGAVVFYGKGDVPLIDHLYSNYPLESTDWVFAGKEDNPEHYNLIMDLISQIPLQNKVETRNYQITDYYIIGANIDWELKTITGVKQRFHYIRVFVDKDYNLYLPEIYPYHSDNSPKIEGNKFLTYHASDTLKKQIDQIISN